MLFRQAILRKETAFLFHAVSIRFAAVFNTPVATTSAIR